MSWGKMGRTRRKELCGTPLGDCGGNVIHPINDKVIGEAGEKWGMEGQYFKQDWLEACICQERSYSALLREALIGGKEQTPEVIRIHSLLLHMAVSEQ